MTRCRFLLLIPLLFIAGCDPDDDIYTMPGIPHYTSEQKHELAHELSKLQCHDYPMICKTALDYNSILLQAHAVLHTDD